MKEVFYKNLLDKTQLMDAAKEILAFLPEEKFFVFRGEMGAGKTTFIKAFCKALDVIDEPSSPTFSLINHYQTKNGQIIYHFDFYRIEKPEEAYEYGYEEYFYSGQYCFVEWAERIPDLLPEKLVEVSMEVVDENTRMITVTKV